MMNAIDAPQAWNLLRGIICVYKPHDTKVAHVRNTLLTNMCRDLNKLECRPPIQHVYIEGEDISKELTVDVRSSLADNPMVTGPRYLIEDLKCSWSNYLGKATSGVLLFGLRSGTSVAKYIRENRSARVYRVSGQLGSATENYYKDGKVIERSTFKHVKIKYVEQALANMQASHQKKMFENCGVDLQSQTAYELALQGPIRPVNSKTPIIYGLKCIHFNSPDFTLEVQCINEYELYLKTLIHEIGMKLHSTAHCTAIQCIRHSCFTLDNALLRKHWTLEHILSSIDACAKIIHQNKHILKQDSISLRA